MLLEKDSLDFSFSGLKTAVKREVDLRIEKNGVLTPEDQREIAFEFEEVVICILVKKILRAQEQYKTQNIILAGGVSANTKLKNRLAEMTHEKNI